MPAERITMRDAREIIRLKFSSVSTHEIARRLGMARSTVRETLKRTEGAGLSWPLPKNMNDEALEAALYARPHPEQGYRACLGIVRLAGSFGAARVEAAAQRAIEIGATTYGSVKSILDARLDRRPAPKRPAETAPILHPNIRGPRYYH